MKHGAEHRGRGARYPNSGLLIEGNVKRRLPFCDRSRLGIGFAAVKALSLTALQDFACLRDSEQTNS